MDHCRLCGSVEIGMHGQAHDLCGDRIADRMPVRLVHAVAAAIFAILGLATLFGAGASLGF